MSGFYAGVGSRKTPYALRPRIRRYAQILDEMGDHDVDSVGAIIKRKAVTSMAEVDFSLGRVDVRQYQRKIALESIEEERISSVDSSEQLKEKGKKEKAAESFH